MKEVKELLEKLRAEKAAILKKSAPLHEKRAALVAKIQPLEVELRAVDAEIKKVERPRLVEVGMSIAQLERVLGAKTLKNDP